jgi:hypothetical protein
MVDHSGGFQSFAAVFISLSSFSATGIQIRPPYRNNLLLLVLDSKNPSDAMPNPTFLEPQSPEESTYHFKIRVPNGPIENAKRYGSKIDNFLDDIFNIGTSPRVDAPLEFEEREMVADGCKSVLVKS